MLTLNPDISQQLKFLGFALLLTSIATSPKFNKKIYYLAPLLIILLINLINSFSKDAAIEELLRFLFPIGIIVALYKSIADLRNIAIFFIWLTITNNVYQIYFYIAYFIGLPVILEPRFEMAYIIRAEGWIGFFTGFGFMNFCAFILTKHGNIFQKRKKHLEYTFLTFSLLSTSLKTFAALLIYLTLTKKNKSTSSLIVASILATALASALYPKIVTDLISVTGEKFQYYVINGNSARAESYRVMKESLLSPNFLGEGLGSFGGPASTKFQSPLYAKYNFNWYGLESLTTTDTYYPHLFVELGLIGGIIYLYFIFSYGQRNRNIVWWIIAISFAMDNLSSFSLASPPYFFAAAICMMLFSNMKKISHPAQPPSKIATN
ncbi:hypothetical protein D3C76_974840 [compost metagenome]